MHPRKRSERAEGKVESCPANWGPWVARNLRKGKVTPFVRNEKAGPEERYDRCKRAAGIKLEKQRSKEEG